MTEITCAVCGGWSAAATTEMGWRWPVVETGRPRATRGQRIVSPPLGPDNKPLQQQHRAVSMASVVREDWDFSCPSLQPTLPHCLQRQQKRRLVLQWRQTHYGRVANSIPSNWQLAKSGAGHNGQRGFPKSYHNYILFNPSIIFISLQ